MAIPKYYKNDLKNLKEELGPAREELKAKNSARRKCIIAVTRTIKEKNLHTVPEIAAEIQFSPHEVLNAINFMMKFYGLSIIQKRGDYPQYGFGDGH